MKNALTSLALAPVAPGAASQTCTATEEARQFADDLTDRWTQKPNQNPGADAVVQVQLWYRDPFNPGNKATSYSDALELTVCP